jgi:threonine dehydratase
VEAIRRLVDDVILVSEAEMLYAIRQLALDEHVVAEPAGAAATAAFLKSSSSANASVALVLTGANVSSEVFRAAIGV